MKKLIVVLLVLLALVGAAFFAGSALLERSSRAGLPVLSKALEERGFSVTELGFAKARIASLGSVAWEDVRAQVRLPEDSAGKGQAARVSIEAVRLGLADLSFRRFRLELEDVNAGPEAGLSSGFDWASARFREAARQGRLIAPKLHVGLELDLREPRPVFERLVAELQGVLREGHTDLAVEVDAGILTRLDDEELWARLRAVEKTEGTAIEVDREDLRRLAEHFSRPLTDGEIGLVSEHPLRAPALLLVKKYAEGTAIEAHEEDPTVPEDAYRHVLWSFLLTKRFGPEFAERVTDAHEVGVTDNTEADHRMDYNNNAVGRRYAASGLSEGQVLGRMRVDPGVIRSPQEAR